MFTATYVNDSVKAYAVAIEVSLFAIIFFRKRSCSPIRGYCKTTHFDVSLSFLTFSAFAMYYKVVGRKKILSF